MVKRLGRIYERLLGHFGNQGWWPADGPFEMAVGAILTQNTSWRNVERAISALKSRDLLDPASLAGTPRDRVRELIRPSGYYRQKTDRLLGFCDAIVKRWDGDLKNLFKMPRTAARMELLVLNGLGPETADSILLYAGHKAVFVVDAYTMRICRRMGLADTRSYNELQRFFEKNIPGDVPVYQEYHALLVALGKEHCLASREKARCAGCPVEVDCETGLLAKI